MMSGKIRDHVVLVNQADESQGTMEKIEAHKKGLLHRAFSVFIFNSQGEILLQQRADNKYHGGGLWTNACCSHPGSEEAVIDGAKERLSFEMGLSCDLKLLYRFIYHAKVENGLTEHELDHVFVGYTNQNPTINPQEVKQFRWANVDEVLAEMKDQPRQFTVWFNMALPKVLEQLQINPCA